MSAIRVYVGCSANNEDLESLVVLEYTIRKYCSMPVEIEFMRLSRDPLSPWYHGMHGEGWRTERWSTPFSGFRWAVPEVAGKIGRAIYMDSDIIVRADLAELWQTNMTIGTAVVAKGGRESWRYCVALFDCKVAASLIPPMAELRRDPASHEKMKDFFKGHPKLVQQFNGNWNCIDGEDYKSLDDPDIKLLHYSSEAHQPHLTHALPRLAKEGGKHWFDGKVKTHWRQDVIDLFDSEYQQAIKNGGDIEQYRRMPFGAYKKKSERNYIGHRWVK